MRRCPNCLMPMDGGEIGTASLLVCWTCQLVMNARPLRRFQSYREIPKETGNKAEFRLRFREECEGMCGG